MSRWTPTDLDAIGNAAELHVAPRASAGTPDLGLQQSIGPLVQLLVAEVGDRMRRLQERIPGHAPRRRHRLAGRTKRLGHDGNRVMLIPENPSMKPFVMDEGRILGRVVGVRRSLP